MDNYDLKIANEYLENGLYKKSLDVLLNLTILYTFLFS